MTLIKQLKQHEGFRGNYYFCTGEKKTIGYGRNVENNPFSPAELNELGRCDFDDQPMTEDEAEMLLLNDVNKVIKLIKPILPWGNLGSARQAVCVNMAFNLGSAGFLKFKNMIAAINDDFYEMAAVEMLDSKWAKQVPNRANELSEQMNKGHW